MAASSKLVGQFIAHRLAEWTEPIPGENGRPDTPPGKSLTLFVFTPHDKDVCEVKVSTVGKRADSKALADMLAVCGTLAFGDAVTVECGDKAYGRYQGHAIKAGSKSAAA